MLNQLAASQHADQACVTLGLLVVLRDALGERQALASPLVRDTPAFVLVFDRRNAFSTRAMNAAVAHGSWL